jgi:hypothetical protein
VRVITGVRIALLAAPRARSGWPKSQDAGVRAFALR